MIILSHTNLSGINLGGINLSEIKLGMPSGKGSGGEETFDPASFDQAWSVTGKTNDDEDRATVKNLTGNGNDLVLSNFAFAGDSGYGLYNQNFKIYGFGNLHSTTYVRTSSKIELNIPGNISENIYSNVTSVGYVYDFNIKVSGLKNGNSLVVTKATKQDDVIKSITKDGVYTIKATVEESWSQFRIYFWIENKNDSQASITIEQISDYEGYLVTDGVDDYIQSRSFKFGKNWTIVGDFIFLDIPVGTNSGISKPQSFYLYNIANGVAITINSGGKSTIIASKYIKAVSSNGRIYYDDWKEAINEEPQTVTSSSGSLFLGGTGIKFTKMAFKNLAVYDGKVLTKDQCINAYNYLQTLKEK